jgi:hypothetical protein
MQHWAESSWIKSSQVVLSCIKDIAVILGLIFATAEILGTSRRCLETKSQLPKTQLCLLQVTPTCAKQPGSSTGYLYPTQWGHISLSRAPHRAINLSHSQGRALTYKFVVKKPRNNLIVRLWSHCKVIARFFSRSDLTVCVLSSVPPL